MEGCEARNAGRSVVDVVDVLIAAGGRETRLGAAEAFREYERAIAWMRVAVVRTLVDEGGLSLTNVAKRMKSHGKRPPGSATRCRSVLTKVPTKAD